MFTITKLNIEVVVRDQFNAKNYEKILFYFHNDRNER